MLTANMSVNREKFMRAGARALMRADRQVFRPLYKGVVLKIVQTLVEGGFGYGGLPQYTGSAVGNVQVGPAGSLWTKNTELSESYRERFYAGEGFGAWADREPYDNNANPNRNRMQQSLSRASGYLRGVKTPTSTAEVLAGGMSHASVIYVPSEYLGEYVDWGGESLWRAENLERFPIAISRIRRRMRGNPSALIRGSV